MGTSVAVSIAISHVVKRKRGLPPACSAQALDRRQRQSVEAGIDLDGVEVAREVSDGIESARLGLGINDGLLVLVSPTPAGPTRIMFLSD